MPDKTKQGELELMTADQAAAEFKITERRLYALVKEGIIPRFGARQAARFPPSSRRWFELYRARLNAPGHDCAFRIRLEQLLEVETAREIEAFEGREMSGDRAVLGYCETRFGAWSGSE